VLASHSGEAPQLIPACTIAYGTNEFGVLTTTFQFDGDASPWTVTPAIPLDQITKEYVIDFYLWSRDPHDEITVPEVRDGLQFGAARDDAAQDRIDEAFAKYHATVNMGEAELRAWAATEWSKKAGVDRSPIERNLRLLSKPKAKWTAADARAAMRTVSFVARMKGNARGEPVKIDGREGPSKRDISLKNWAFNPSK